ncbi:MAG: 2-hydroxychromene-2-carboxylate isomerase [Alphaproteobacteria bacterium]
MPAAQPIEFYFEFASPYGYFASKLIDGIAARHGRSVDWRPIMLGAALKATGSQPNIAAPIKGVYFQRDVLRCGGFYGMPIKMPPVMPMNSLAATRAFYWLQESDPAKAKALAQAVYAAHWGEGRDMSGVDDVASAAAAIGIDESALRAAVQEPRIKEKVKDVTMASLEKGVFGSPFVIVDGEAFWGADRLDQVERWLSEGSW